MIITCQQCNTSYNIEANKIGDGKTVFCQNCSNSWHQNPIQETPSFKPRASSFSDMPPMVISSSPKLTKTPEEPQSSLAINEDKTTEPTAEFSSEDDTISSELLDDMFGEDNDSESFYSDDEPTSDDEADIDNPEDFEDPEPIPGVFMNQEDDQDDDDDSTSSKRKKIGIAAIFLLLALCGSLFFGRSYVMDMMGGSQIGEGLDIQNVKSVRKDDGGVDILIVKGEVANKSKEVRAVPMIKVVLYDGAEKEVEKTIVAPLKSSLKAGAKIRFTAKISKPSALARRMEVTFSEAKK